MAYKTKQEIFNVVWENLTEQGRPSMTADGSCLYNGPEGSHCALGWLINAPEEIQFRRFPASVWEDANIDSTLVVLSNFLVALQNAHDEAAEADAGFVTELHKHLREVAEKYMLETSGGNATQSCAGNC